MANKMGPPINLLLLTIYLNHLLPDYLQISYMDYFYQTLTLSDNQNGRHLSVYTCGHSISFIYHQISSIYGLLSSNYCSCLNMGLSDE